jgi:glycine/D-amino acid oxidase-like deaminating enzyme
MTRRDEQSQAPAARWGEPPWRIPFDSEAVPPPPPRRCDVVVIGAGFAGLSAAYFLARRGVRVAVLEAATIGAGASGRTGGLVLEGTAAGPLEQVEHCLEAIAGVVEEARIACDLTLPGCWQVHHEAMAAGRPPAWRDGDGLIVRVGTEPGGTVDPGKLIAGLACAARSAGATLHQHTPARAIEAEGERRYRVRGAEGATIEAEQVVVALNAYTTQLVKVPPPFRAPLTLALCTAPVDEATLAAIGMAERMPFYTLDMPYLWGRWVVDGRVIFGAGLIFPQDDDVRSVDLNASEAAQSMARLEARVRGLHPALAEVEVTHRWGGPIAFRHSGVPILSRMPDAPGVITFGGCAGHGVALSVRVGQLIAAAVGDGAPLPEWGALRD